MARRAPEAVLREALEEVDGIARERISEIAAVLTLAIVSLQHTSEIDQVAAVIRALVSVRHTATAALEEITEAVDQAGCGQLNAPGRR